MSNQELPIESAFECSVCWADKDGTTGSFTIDESLICKACVIDTIQPMFEAALEHDEAFPVRWGSIILKPEDFPGAFPLALSLRYESRGIEIYSKVKIFCKQLVVTGEDEFGAAVKLLAIPIHDGEASEECGCLLGVKDCTAPGSITCPDCLGETCWQCGEPVSEDPFADWVLGRDYQLCPGCGAPTIISEGCNAMICTRCLVGYCFSCGVRAHENLDKAHWEVGGPCPKYNARGAYNAWQPYPDDYSDLDDDEADPNFEYFDIEDDDMFGEANIFGELGGEIENVEGMMAAWQLYTEDDVSDGDGVDEDENEEDEEDEEGGEDDQDGDSGNHGRAENGASPDAYEEASEDEEEGGSGVEDEERDSIAVDIDHVVVTLAQDNVTEEEWQAALAAQSETFNASQQHLIQRIEDLLQLPEGLAETDPDHYNIRLQETAVLRVFVDMARSFRDFVDTQPVLTTENIRILGSNNRTLKKLEPLVSKLSSCLESRFLMEAAERFGDAITRAHIGEHIESLLQLTAEIDDSM
ncbi:hypothetical protein LTR27_012605 [Elasticomyces elasticus]|nr:hypothetical protein LTR27_012605 [Elasticomyces elasticus]